jgi:hypothetical protein
MAKKPRATRETGDGPEVTGGSHPGFEALAFYRTQMSLEDRWTVPGDFGFEWWGDGFCQRAWATPPTFDPIVGRTASRVIAETDVASGDIGGRVEESLGAMMLLSSMSGLILADDGRSLRLRCSLKIHEGDVKARAMFSAAAALQQWTSSRLASNLEALGLTALTTEHPTQGHREDPSPGIAGFVDKAVAYFSAEPSRWRDPDEFLEVANAMRERGIAVGQPAEGLGALSVPIGFGSPTGNASLESPTLIRVLTGDGHERLGNGLFLLMTLPASARAVRPDLSPLALNAREESLQNGPARLGSWCYIPSGPARQELGLAYVSFVPNIAYMQGWLQEAMFGMVIRGTWASTIFHSPA